MKIEIELNDQQIEQAYRDRRKYYNKCDLVDKIGMYCGKDINDLEDDEEVDIGDRELTGKQVKDLIDNKEWINRLAEDFESALDCNNSYWESFWNTAEEVIEDAVEKSIPKSEKQIRRERNREKYKNDIEMIWRLQCIPTSMKCDIVEQIVNREE